MFSIKEAIAWSYNAYKKYFGVLAKLGLVNVAVLALMTLLGSIAKVSVLGSILFGLVAVVSVIVSYFVMAGMYHVGSVAVSGGEVSRPAIVARIRSLILPLVWVVIVTASFTLVWLPTIIGVFIASVFSALTLVVLFAENKRGLDSVATSITLVKGSFWKFIGYGIVVGIIVLVPFLVFAGIVGALFGATPGKPNAGAELFLGIAQAVYVMPAMTLALFGAYRGMKAAAVEPTPEVYARRRTFVKVCAIAGPIVFVICMILAVAAFAMFGSFGA